MKKINLQCDVILTYGWNRVAYNVLRNLAKNNLNVVVADESKYNMCSISKYSMASFQYASPFIEPELFIEKLVEMVDVYKPKVLIPCHEESFVIAKYLNKFPKDLKIPICKYETLLEAHDKLNASNIAKDIGVPVPKIYDVNSVDELEAKKDYFTYPVVLKLPNSNASKGVFYAYNFKELKSLYLENFDLKNKLYIQEYIDGIGYGASFVYDNGKIISGFVHKRLLEKTHTGGVSTKRISVKNNQLFDHGKALLDKLEWTGSAMVEFKYNEEKKQAWFIEINARYWGSLPLPIAAGLDLPYWHYLSAINQPIQVKDYQEGIVSQWILGSFITLAERVVSKKLSWKELKLILDFRADNYDDLKSDDLKAFAGELLYYFTKFLKTGSTNPKVEGMGNF